MNTEVFNSIDTLIEMAGEDFKYTEDVNLEIISLEKQIDEKNNEIEDFKSLINDSRYFNASNELVDKNIENSLKNKITRLKRKVKEINVTCTELNKDEELLHEEITNLRNKMSLNEEYINTLEAKTTNTKNEYYNNILKVEKDNFAKLKEVLSSKNSMYDNILKELELNNQAKSELQMKINNENARLEEILDNLSNPNAYIDLELKASDEKRLDSLKNELASLEKKKLELLTSASVIGADAKELTLKSDIDGALTKIKELVTIVKARPYMDINDSSILEEELEKLENERIELANLIDSKNYDGVNSNAIKERIDYLNKEIENNKETLTKLKNEIDMVDNHISNILGKKISELESEIIKNENTALEYKELLKTKDDTSVSKINLEQAITKKQKEIELFEGILASYKKDLVVKINITNEMSLEENRILEENKNYQKELDELKKISLTNYKTKDLIEEEKDKELLRKINEDIKNLKIRKEYEKSPDEIYDQIEMSLASIPRKNKNISLDSKESLKDSFTPNIDEIIENTVFKVNDDDKFIKVIDIRPVEE